MPKEGSVPFAEPEAAKEEAPNVGYMPALTDAMWDAQVVQVACRSSALAAGRNALALVFVRPR